MLSINDTHSQTHTTAIRSCWILNWLTVCPPNELTNWSLWSAGLKGGNWWERSPLPSLSSSSSFLAVLSMCHRSCLCGETVMRRRTHTNIDLDWVADRLLYRRWARWRFQKAVADTCANTLQSTGQLHSVTDTDQPELSRGPVAKAYGHFQWLIAGIEWSVIGAIFV